MNINQFYPKMDTAAQILTKQPALKVPKEDFKQHEPRHDKTNKATMRPAKTQISFGKF